MLGSLSTVPLISTWYIYLEITNQLFDDLYLLNKNKTRVVKLFVLVHFVLYTDYYTSFRCVSLNIVTLRWLSLWWAPGRRSYKLYLWFCRWSIGRYCLKFDFLGIGAVRSKIVDKLVIDVVGVCVLPLRNLALIHF